MHLLTPDDISRMEKVDHTHVTREKSIFFNSEYQMMLILHFITSDSFQVLDKKFTPNGNTEHNKSTNKKLQFFQRKVRSSNQYQNVHDSIERAVTLENRLNHFSCFWWFYFDIIPVDASVAL
eukprot:GDKJ01012575.1.p1 GENE.GDKJ01012575.1~~GDKJ01012575.1.p1  ORF type:complete len:122 (-),score=10.20 GDKJ01012575.1:753-1118(-)